MMMSVYFIVCFRLNWPKLNLGCEHRFKVADNRVFDRQIEAILKPTLVGRRPLNRVANGGGLYVPSVIYSLERLLLFLRSLNPPLCCSPVACLRRGVGRTDVGRRDGSG